MQGATIEEELRGQKRGKRKSQGVLFIKENEKSDIFTKRGNPLISLTDLAIIPLKK